jgi:hypothetical protein
MTAVKDPLYVIFEQHLFNFQDSEIDRKTFIGNVVQDYISHLRKLDITIPKPLEQPVVEELCTQVNTMLVKKIYGCLSIGEYQQKVPSMQKRKARTQYTQLRGAKAPARKRA